MSEDKRVSVKDAAEAALLRKITVKGCHLYHLYVMGKITMHEFITLFITIIVGEMITDPQMLDMAKDYVVNSRQELRQSLATPLPSLDAVRIIDRYFIDEEFYGKPS